MDQDTYYSKYGAVKFETRDDNRVEGTFLPLPCYDSSPNSAWRQVFNVIKSGTASESDLHQIHAITICNKYEYKAFKRVDQKVKKQFNSETLPTMFYLASIHPQLFQEPVLFALKKTNTTLSLTRIQVASLLSLAFMGFFKLPDEFRDVTKFPLCFFCTGGKIHVQKVLSYIAYFEGITKFLNTKQHLDEIITLHRTFVENTPDWSSCQTLVRTDTDVDNNKLIEERLGCLEADFANATIGGGVLNMGLVQEEIAFIKNTESLVSLLLCPTMTPNESIRMNNVIEYSTGTDYGNKYTFSKATYDKHESHDFVAFDAMKGKERKDTQYQPHGIQRELNKVYSAVLVLDTDKNVQDFATGKWGSGAYHGDMRLKFIIQLCACSLAGRKMLYHTFHDEPFGKEIKTFLESIQQNPPTISKLYNYMVNCQDPTTLLVSKKIPKGE
ncbi:poly(ADP-ribose) glycohydrolase [Entamoeba marina]